MQTRTSGCEVPSPARARGRAWAVGVSALLGAHVLSASAQDRPRDDPPPTAQDCNTRLIRVEASGLPFRAEGELCDPIPYLQPVDPCWARWGLDTNVPAPHAWGLLEHTVPQPNAKPVSACWHEVYKTFFIACREGNLPINLVPGYSLNINLLASPSIGDFLPPAATLGASSVALVPQGAASAPTGWRGLQRPVHEGAVDLITGSPLARTSELELPFAGAAFRLVRTRSHSQRVEVYACHVDDTWWDWTGNGWMASEAPLLLIDSAVPDIVGDNPRTTYLVLDAHHSIPFQRFEDSGRYEAPARFRAGLTHNGQWGAGGWITPPTWYKASLYDGALTYTFVVVREDVPLNIWSTFASTVPCQAVGEPYDPLDPHSCVSSMHARPFLPQQFGGAKPWWDPISLSQNPGQGLPFYGLCTRIEDRYGHVVEISYGSQTQYALDNPQSPPPDEPPPPGCVECLQDCPGKGQIRSIRLRRGAETYWTLLYRYRIAPADPGGGQEDCAAAGQLAWGRQIPVPFDHFGTRVIDSIHVYQGDRPEVDTLAPGFYSISTEFRCFDGASLPTAAALDYEHPALALPTSLQDWVHSVRYHYGFQHDFETGPAFEQEGMLEQFPRLFKVSAASRRQLAGGAPVTTEPAVVRSWVFEYASPAGMNQDAWLVSVYEPDAVDRAIVAFRRLQPGIAEFGASWLALALNYGGFTTTFNSGVMPALRAEASVRWTPDPVPGTTPGYFQTMLPGGRPAYIRTAAPLELPNYDSQVGTLALTGDQGQGRFYRFRRFVAGADVDDAPRPHRSAFHVPYTWRSYGNPPFTPEPQPLEDFTQPRWITIIDEFDSAQAMTDGAGLQGAPPSYLTAPGMVGRRVLHVGASGVVLRDHYWKFKNGELIDSGGAGLGAENVYWPAEAFLAAEGMTLPPVPPREPGPIPGLTLPPDDPLAHLRNELLLVEHRSVGWSVAENNLAGLTQGFVRFFEYEALTYDTDPANPGDPIGQSNWLTDTGARVELRAEGVKEGQAYTVNAAGELEENDNGKPRLYTRDILRPGDPSDPGGLPSAWQQPDDPERWEYLCEVRYLVPAEDAARITAPPPPGDPPPLTGGPRPEPTVALSYQLTKRRADDPNDPRPAFERATESTLAIGPARQQRPGGSWYFPVDRQVFDTEGKLLRQMSGLVRNPIYPGGGNDGLEALSHTVHIYNSEGRTRHTLADVAVGANGELPSAYTLNHFQARERPAEAQVQESELTPAPPCPPGWTISPLVPPRNYVTTYVYGNIRGRLSDVYYPSGRRWASRILVVTHDERPPEEEDPRALGWNFAGFQDYFGSFPLMEREQWFAREYVFNDVELYTDDPDGPGGEPGVEHNYSRMLGEIRDYGNKDALGAPIITRRVFFATPSQFENIEVPFVLDDFLAEPRLDIQPRFLEEQRVEYAVDSAGRLARADLLETGPNNMIVQVGHETVYDLVDVVRTYSFDGTITRVVRNLLGQTIRRYVGTDDSAWVFPNWETTGLALLERLEYGTGVNDAWLPTVARRYTSNPQWATDPFSELDPEEEDPDGFVTLTSYDWRMRPVRVDQFGETASGNRDKGVAPRLLTTLTYLDHAGKPAVVATFGAGTLQVPAALDPVLRREWQQPWRPAVSDLYALAIKPISVTELFYGPDGEIVERRAYHHDPNAPVGQQLSWHEEHACAGRGGITVYEQRPERPVTVSTLDGLGRRVSSTDLGWNGTAWARQLNRTDYLPDAEGNVCASARFERVIEDDNALVADSQFGAVNAVRTRSLAWFDPQKRLTASADLGSESRGAAGLGPDMLVAGPTAYERVVNDGNASEPYIHVPAQGDPEIRRVGLPDWARLSINRYSMLTGRLIWTAHPDGAITEFGYDKAGRLARRTENRFADTGVGEPSRRTDYEYTLGRLTGIVAYRVGAGVADGHKQVTRLVYGARVLAQEPTASPGNVPPLYVESGVHHASLIGRLHLPHPQTGGPTYLPPTPIPPTHEDPGLDTGEIVLRYNFQGQVAERIDARGVVFRYFYDGLERLSWIVVGCYDQGVFQAALPPSLASPSAPAARVMSVQYLYDAQGRLSDVIARASGTDPNSVISHNRYAYDTRGNVTTEWQGHQGLLGPTPPASTPRVDYTWSYRATDTPLGHVGHDRLDLIKYPAPPGSNEAGRRHVQFAYGDAGLLDDRLSRLRAVTSGVGGATEPIAAFDYAGLARRASLTLGTGSSAITAGLLAPGGPGEPIGLTGLDMFGALRDLHYRNTAGTTLFRAQLGHDVSGNRLFERVTQWPAPSLSTPGGHLADARSQLHGYDWFDRLTATSLGRLESDGSGIIPGTVLREDSWWLDLLGNWQPVPGAPPPTPETGRLTQGNLDGFQPAGAVAPVGGTSLSGTFVRWQDPGGPPDADPDDLHVAPDVDARNEVGAVVSRNSLAGSWTQETEVRHDAAGNVIFDGTYIYQYDAWNRLVQVNAGAIDVSLAPTPGEPYSDLRFGAMLKHYTHDGLGRLVRTRSPFPNPQTASPGQERSERFYYDGIRRIQETRLDPAPPLADAMPAKGSSSQPLEPGTPGELEGAPAGPPAESAPIPTAATTLVREYVWGPGDAWHPASVDELLVYYAEARKAWWPLHDASGDVAAVAAPGTSTENFRARVVAQQRYEAYGQVSSADHLLAHPFLSVGHKGLFYDRLDRGVSDSSATGAAVPPNGSVVETPRLVPFARGVYHLRNRTVIPGGGSPSLVGLSSIVPQGPPSNPTWVLSQKGLSSGAAVHGRFMQADPNSTALVLIRKAVFHGEPWPVERDQFDLGLRVTDGANLYAYLGSNPWNGSDPLGLWMWGDWSDTLAKGAEVFGLAVAVLDTYQFVMEEAVDWALDWDRPDDEINELSAIANAVGSDVDAEVDVVAGPYGPMIAGIGSSLKAAATIAKVLGKGKRLFYNWLCKGPKNVTVYMGKRNGRPYVGISNDIVRRGGEHGTKLKPLATGLTRNQARALENKIIKENPHFDNTIQSIADKHRFAQWADEFATELASKMGIRIKY